MINNINEWKWEIKGEEAHIDIGKILIDKDDLDFIINKKWSIRLLNRKNKSIIAYNIEAQKFGYKLNIIEED